ncbi:MAG: phage tail protein [Leptolyngbyaceae cyanobacterium bins.302]|nr:phage tail protein [Leptolyngbyaceae cyanobacterium bins.302]
MTQTGAYRELNYVTANRFYVEMESTIKASFTECSGLGIQIKHETHREGGVNDQQRVLLGQPEFSDITLKRGSTNDLAFWTWIEDILAGKPRKRRNINIIVFNQSGETMQCWTLIGAVPVGWKAPALQADSSAVAIEELTLAYEGLQVKASRAGGIEELTRGRDKTGYFPGSTS